MLSIGPGHGAWGGEAVPPPQRATGRGERALAYLAVLVLRLGVTRRLVRLRGVAQLLLGARVALLQRRQLGGVGLHLLQRRLQRLRLRGGGAAQRVQRRGPRLRRRRHAGGECAAGRHA